MGIAFFGFGVVCYVALSLELRGVVSGVVLVVGGFSGLGGGFWFLVSVLVSCGWVVLPLWIGQFRFGGVGLVGLVCLVGLMMVVVQ